MNQKYIDGNNYKYVLRKILVQGGLREIGIKAVSKESNRCSYINNLNPVLSELDVRMDDARSSESTWLLTTQECQEFEAIAMSFLTDRKFQTYLEKSLDEDRALSEWENFEYHPNP